MSARVEVVTRVLALLTFLAVAGSWTTLRATRDASHEELGRRESELHRVSSMLQADGSAEQLASAEPGDLRDLFGAEPLRWSRRGDAVYLTFEDPRDLVVALRGGK